jgi:tetratricopeptide (TPR) repeat protein
MLSLKRGILLSSFFIFGVIAACGQTRPKAEQDKPKFEVNVTASTGKEAERQIKEIERLAALRRKFTEEYRKCRDLTKDRNLKEAEGVCKTAVQLADQLEVDSKWERMRAYESFGHIMLGQERFQEALEYYSRALDFGLPSYTEEDAELGRLYGNLAITQHMLGNLDKARELYRKSEQIYHHAYTTFVVTNTAEGLEEQKQIYLESLKLILKRHRIAAQDAGATAEIEEIDKMLKSLP